MDQVGSRSLLQYGQMSTRALAGLLFWRKWIFDIDNRAGQETGYLFEPIIAQAIGGVPFSHTKSPIRRVENPRKGRQVDCIKRNLAYEFKVRVTIAASGQGRWKEELDFPEDCRKSGYNPMLVVLDPTPNPKINELKAAYEKVGGSVFIGEGAWRHLEEAAGETMSKFLEKYVRAPIQDILNSSPEVLPELHLKMTEAIFSVSVNGEHAEFKRAGNKLDGEEGYSELPEDVDQECPGL